MVLALFRFGNAVSKSAKGSISCEKIMSTHTNSAVYDAIEIFMYLFQDYRRFYCFIVGQLIDI